MCLERIHIERGDITKYSVDAMVNAANSGLRGGGGVDGAIHRAGGPQIMAECRKIGRCETGDAVVTTAGRLPARYVIHAVGPIYRGDDRDRELLSSAYRRALECAKEVGARTVAFPAISAGAYGYPLDEAAEVALTTIRDFLRKVPSIEVFMVLYTMDAWQAFQDVYKKMLLQEARAQTV